LPLTGKQTDPAPEKFLASERIRTMTFREHVQDHLHKSATHHAAVAALHNKISKTHETLAGHHGEHAGKEQGHRDLAQFHSTLSQHHADRQRHYAAMHEKMGDIGDSELLPSHSDAGDSLRQVTHADFLKRVCGVEI
jgi:hypothetical protein